MKKQLIRILAWIVKRFAQATIWRYRPGVIGVTGSVGKTSTKLAIAAVLGAERPIRYSSKNFNNELGVPLTILGDFGEIRGRLFYPRVIAESIWRILVRDPSYPEMIVLEYGVDRPGDMRYLTGIAQPNIGVITAIGDVPAHVEFFDSPESVAREKAWLVESLPNAGFAVLNADDERVMAMRDRTRAHVVTYGFSKNADVRVTAFAHETDGARPFGITFSLEYGGSGFSVRVPGAGGKSHAYAAAAATAVGLTFGMPLQKITNAIGKYRPVEGRMEYKEGLKGSWIINDAYNASPLSVENALDALRSLPAKRRIAVLGDMRELGKYSAEAHERVGAIAAKSAQVLVTVGLRAKGIADGARAAGMKKTSIQSFETAAEAHPKIQDMLKKGDLVLVKGSRAVGLELVVEEIKAL